MKKLLYTNCMVLMLGLSLKCHAQYGNIWAFGYHYGLDFNNGAPVFFDTTSIKNIKGSASVCDINGQLLFYTDGTRVWNKLHQQMLNGDSLGFSSFFGPDTITGTTYDSCFASALQSAIIIPIENTNKYYIFTTDFYSGPLELKYHIVDLSLNSGLGDVIIKNQLLLQPVTEKLTATRHCNGLDWWIVARRSDNNEYASFLVTPDSVFATPTISQTIIDNSVYPSDVGQIKISPNGKMIASSYEYHGLEMGTFNNITGQIDIILRDILQNWKSSYGCAFSSDSKFLYNTVQYIDSLNPSEEFWQHYINRYEVDNLDSSIIMQSKMELVQRDSIYFWFSMQLAPDGNIYTRGYIYDTTQIQQSRNELFVINQGTDSVKSTAFVLPHPGLYSSFGLPTFPDAIFTNHHKASLRIPTCVSGVFDSIPFFDSLLTVTRDYLWNFGDPASGVNNTFNGQFPVHAFSSPGTYTVTLSLPSDCNPISVTMQVTTNTTIAVTPVISLNSFFLESTPATQYQWYINNVAIAGANNQTFTPVVNGNYTVMITDSNNCTATSNVFNFTNVGLQINNPNNFTVFPNPAKETLHISNPNKKQTQVIVYSLIGTSALQYQLSNASETIDISSLANGIYILKIDNQFNQKIVINK